MRRIGLLITGSQSNALSLAQAAAIRDGLEKLGWVNGRNVQIEFRFGDSLERLRAHAADFGAMNLDVIFAGNASALVRLKEASGATPIVFANVPDPGWYRRLPPAERVSATSVFRPIRKSGAVTGCQSCTLNRFAVTPCVVGKESQVSRNLRATWAAGLLMLAVSQASSFG